MIEKHDQAGRFTRPRSRKMRGGPNKPPENAPWGWMTLEMQDSAAWLVCPDAARRAINLIWAEHMRHAGQDNGRLPVTWRNFQRGGIRQGSIKLALAQAEALGFIRMTGRGRPAKGRDPGTSALWALTWLPIIGEAQATNPWKAFKDVASARAAVARVKAERAPAKHPSGEIIDSASNSSVGRPREIGRFERLKA